MVVLANLAVERRTMGDAVILYIVLYGS